MNYARNCGLGAFLDSPRRVPDVILGHDIVAREHGIGFVARHRASGLLRNAAADHVPNARAPEVVEEQARDAGGFREIVHVPRKSLTTSPFSRVKR